MTKQPDQFSKVTFAKELQKVRKDIETKATMIAGMTGDGKQFQFNVRQVVGETIQAEVIPPASRPLIEGEELQILFGLPDGLFLVRTPISLGKVGTISFGLGSEVFKLQRRSNFRATIPSSTKVGFQFSSIQNVTVTKVHEVSVLDLSANGARLKWSGVGLADPKPGDTISGHLKFSPGRPIEVFATIRAVMAGAGGGLHVGIEFQNVSQRDEQTLLFICMQFLRAQMPVV